MLKTGLMAPALALVLLLWTGPAHAAQVRGPEVRTAGQALLVSTGLSLDETEIKEIESGIPKEMDIFIGLYKEEAVWPDDYVLGIRFTQSILCDPVKEEYVASSEHGSRVRERRFRDCGALMDWALNIPERMLTHTGELERARYFVKVTAESRLRRLPQFMAQLFFFVPQREFLIESRSAAFMLGPEGAVQPPVNEAPAR